MLGAGASLAAFPDGERNGLKLPLMDNFVETVHGIADYLDKCGIDYKGKNFEDLYSALYEDSKYDEIRQAVEELTYDYFTRMELPEEPTLYDHLILSLTGRDTIATFNWDPFVWQAMCRNYSRVGEENLPHPLYLHGNTAIGVCTEHKKIQICHKDTLCPVCKRLVRRSKLLHPIGKKNYNSDMYIKSSWDNVKRELQEAYMLTVFGYGAPSSDVEAVDLLSEGWGDKYQRSMEEIEIIDIVDEDTLCHRWDRFIHTHHYSTHIDFYSSMIGKFSRRSVDAAFDANFHCVPWEEYPIPKGVSWDELDEWLKPYIEMENKTRPSG